MPDGKPAGVRCYNLDDNNCCLIHGTEEYPDVCRAFSATPELCGKSNKEAYERLGELEALTAN